MSEAVGELTCPTCGPTQTQEHTYNGLHGRIDVLRCHNCKTWLSLLSGRVST